MSPLPPPAGWERDLALFRSSKDAGFRASEGSPIPPAERAAFRGLEYYPPDATLRLEGWIEPFPERKRVELPTNTSEIRQAERYGRVTFDRGGKRLALVVYRFLDEPGRTGGDAMFLGFTDATTGRETYPGGRFVDLVGPEGGPFVLDFNRAYFPFCAYGMPGWSCPVPPAENRLPVAIEAGERGRVRHAS